MGTRSRIKKVSYVLQVTCDKVPEMNEKEFLDHVRNRLANSAHPILLNGNRPTVSVTRRVEEFINPAKEQKHES